MILKENQSKLNEIWAISSLTDEKEETGAEKNDDAVDEKVKRKDSKKKKYRLRGRSSETAKAHRG
eukprot:TRINITY_DN2772_c0_g1_i1.p1 TRINITY_DN2772_c0_g1~~TRINITY_DN2772_c0_g1_i1.p1  ORF type:complete len:65 (+),score=45.72 TRINITY_DN2772_c0_g1_i1:308-502(+)